MKLNNKTRPILYRFLALGALFGTLVWALAELLAAAAGLPFSLSVGPVGFDIHVLAIWIRVNPGTLLGLVGGIILFRGL